MLLSVSFANLGYIDPFPPATQLGQPSQTTPNIFTDSFTDQTGTSNTGVLADHYWAGQSTVTRTLPTWLQGSSGVTQMSVEFWFKAVPPQYAIGGANIIDLPGFDARTSWQWGATPAGVLQLTFTGNVANGGVSEPLQNLAAAVGVIPDGQWHQYAATFDTKTASYYMDGQLVDQTWVGNTATQIGPKNLITNATASTPTAITYNPFAQVAGCGMDEVRVSNTVLTPTQVKRNFENYRSYANTWYASPTGLATNAGTQASPFDLATALTHATTDNKIILLPGTYNGAQFHVTGAGISPLHDVLITGADYSAGTSGQAIIQTTGTTQGASVSGTPNTGQYVTLQNLTFSTDQSVGLAFSGAGYGNVVDSSRITSNVGGMTVANTPGYQDSVSGVGSSGQHFDLIPGVTLENSVIAPGAGATAVSYTASPVAILRNNTMVGGSTGAAFSSATTNVSLLDNILTGQTTASVYFSNDSRIDGAAGGDGSVAPGYEGDGNIYNPAAGGYVGTIETAVGVNTNYAGLDSYAQYWYVLQYSTTSGGSPIKSWGDNGAGIGTRSDGRSLQMVPAFTSSSGGDFRLASTVGNLIDTGAAQIYGRQPAGGYPTVWDGVGAARIQGNAIDSGAYETAGPINRTFTLAAPAITSAGVYDANNNLIRTLWSGLSEPAGNVTAYWNGLNDSNVPAPVGNYTIKLLTSNVQYVWDGAMNNSSPMDGPNVNGSLDPIGTMVVIGTTAYYSAGWDEGAYQLYKFNLSNPYQTTGYAVPISFSANVINHLSTDGTYLYAQAEAQSISKTPQIEKFDTNFNLLATANVSATYGSSGIAAQPAGYQNLVFVSHATDNKVYIYNAGNLTAYTTPYLDGTVLGWNTPQAVAVNSAGDLWVTCKNTSTGQWQVLRYTNFAGTPTLAATITGFTNPLGLAVSTDGANTLMVADGEVSGVTVTQQIKAYNNAGTAQWTLGQAGGYATNGPAVANDKFILQGMISPQPDGSFWISDFGGGQRTMHFSNTRQFLGDISYTASYSAAVDQNNTTRVFQTTSRGHGSIVEYQIDYTKPFTENQGWTPVKNWTYVGNKNLLTTTLDVTTAGLNVVATLGNGRTYALLGTYLLTGNSNDNGKFNVVELTASGLRDTGVQTPQWASYWLNGDGALIYSSVSAGTDTLYKKTLSGFDVNGNPQYAAATTVAAVPWSFTWDTQPPAPNGQAVYGPLYLTMPNGNLAVYNQAVHTTGMHLGAINPTTNSYQWQAMPGTGPLNGLGNFDTNAWYGGSRVMLSGSSVFVSYYGEGWISPGNSQGEANQFMQYNSDGLFIGQFASPLMVGNGTWYAGYGTAGNSFSPFTVNSNGTTYLYLNDEAHRSLQRWHLTGENTIQEQIASVALAPTVLIDPATLNGSFEQSTTTITGWQNWYGIQNGTPSYAIDTAVTPGATQGSNYFQGFMTATANGTVQGRLDTNIITVSPTAGTLFTLSADVHSAVTIGDYAFDMIIPDILFFKNGGYVGHITTTLLNITAGGGWQHYSPGTVNGSTINGGDWNGVAVRLPFMKYGATIGNIYEGFLDNVQFTQNVVIGIPAAPTGLGATPVSATQVNLSWTASSGLAGGMATGYNIYRGTTSGQENYGAPLNGGTPVATTTYSDTTAAAGTTYYYIVEAVNASGSSVISNEANALTFLAAPTGLSAAVSASPNQLNLNWTAPAGTVSGYNIYRGTTPGGEGAAPLNGAAPVATTAYSDTSLPAGTTYYYTIKAVNASGSSVASTEANAATAAALALPTSLVGYWRLDENTGTTVYDTATGGGTADNGTITGATWTTGKIGHALSFSGSSQYVTVNNSTDLNITGNTITLECWAKSGAGTWNVSAPAFLAKNSAYTFGPYGSYGLQAKFYLGGAWRTATYSPSSWTITNWNQFAAVYNGSTIQLYVNGAAVGTPVSTTGNLGSSTSTLYLGRDTGSHYLNGSLDEVRLYNSAQSASNIAALYNQAALSVTGIAHGTVQNSALTTTLAQYSDAAYTLNASAALNPLLGGTVIQTANADRLSTANQLVSLTTNTPTVVYILYDAAITGANKAAWLSTFTDTGTSVTNSSGHTFAVYKQVVSAGTLWLGGNLAPGGVDQGGQMYSVLLQPLSLNNITNLLV